MCEVCNTISADYDIVLPKQYERTMTYIQDLIDQKQLIPVEGNCDIDQYKSENGCWAGDVIYHILKCPECGQLFRCSIDTYHGKGGFARV